MHDKNAIVSTNVLNAIIKLAAADVLPAVVSKLVLGNVLSRSHFECSSRLDYELANNDYVPSKAKTIEATFQVPDVHKVLSVPELLNLYMEPAVAALVEKIERDIAACLNTAGTFHLRSSLVDDEGLRRLSNSLVSRKFEHTFAQRCVVVGSGTYTTWRKWPSFREYKSAGEAGFRSLIAGKVGLVHNLFVFESEHIHSDVCYLLEKHMAALYTARVGRLAGDSAIENAEIGNFGLQVLSTFNTQTLHQEYTLRCMYSVMLLRDLAIFKLDEHVGTDVYLGGY